MILAPFTKQGLDHYRLIFLQHRSIPITLFLSFYPSTNLWKGYCDHFCLSVSVCLFVCKHDYRRKNHPVLTKLGQIVYNYKRKDKFEDGLCPLIVLATTIKKPLEIMEMSHNKSVFQHIAIKFAQ